MESRKKIKLLEPDDDRLLFGRRIIRAYAGARDHDRNSGEISVSLELSLP